MRLGDENLKINLATILTMIRIAAIPVIVLCFYWPSPQARPIAGVVFGIAAVTDLLDGYVARNYGQMSRFGAFLDPVADKLLVAIVLVLLVQGDPGWYVDMVAMLIIGREITISALREWMATIGARGDVAVSWIPSRADRETRGARPRSGSRSSTARSDVYDWWAARAAPRPGIPTRNGSGGRRRV